MFKNKNENMNNVCGKRIAELRLALNPKCSQRQLAEKLQLFGLDLDKNPRLVYHRFLKTQYFSKNITKNIKKVFIYKGLYSII